MHSNMDLYSELGVTPQAEPEVIRAAYRALALRYHPDRQAGAMASAKMARINHAYSVLSKPESRHAHDESLRTPPARSRFVAPQIHVTSCRSLNRSVQPFLTTYDQRGRLHAFV
jgi:curved DNA-binding protein CbpA